MSAGPSNWNAKEAPIHTSNQIVESPGRDYFYEEYPFWVKFTPQIAGTFTPVTAQAVAVKRGRLVTIHIDSVGGTIATAPTKISAIPWSTEDPVNGEAVFLPERFLPITGLDAGNVVSYKPMFYTEAGGQAVMGRLTIGTKGVNKGGEFLLATALGAEFQLGGWAFQDWDTSYLAPSAYNTPYVDA